MSAITSTPTNRNFLSPLNFKLLLKRAPYLNFFVQNINIPGIQFEGGAAFPTPFVKIPVPGDHINFTPLVVTYQVDEDFVNYLEIFNWIIGLGFPQNFDQYKDLAEDTTIGGGVKSDIVLSILSSAKNPNIEVNFVDAYPIALGDLVFDTQNSDVQYIQTSVTFDYTYYTIKRL